ESALAKEGSVFSGRSARPPRWASISNGVSRRAAGAAGSLRAEPEAAARLSMRIPRMRAGRDCMHTSPAAFLIVDLVEPPHRRGKPLQLDLAYGARVLRQSPVGGEGLVERLQEKRSVIAAVPDDHDGLIRMACADEAQNVRHASDEILQRLALREAHE